MNQSLDVFACEPGWEAAVADELTRVFSSSQVRPLDPGWVTSEVAPADRPAAPIVALASQCLPAAAAIEADSISNWVRAIGPLVIESLAEHDGPWRLHVFGVYWPDGPVGPRRAALIENGIIELLRKKQRRLLRSMTPGKGLFAADEALVQVGLVAPTNGFVSVCKPDLLSRLRYCVSPFPAGIVEIPPDKQAPSRAFAKLLEAEIRVGRRIEAGETCVDLGSSPGSWAYAALGRGARVVAIDRSPLRADLMKHPQLEFVKGDAFTFKPSAPVDWLLCDVIAFPERIFELLQRWITERWCRNFCVTIKFRGSDDYHKLEPIKAWFAANVGDFLIRRLTNNKNEVTLAGGW